MKVTVRSFALPKIGNTAEENEDAYHPEIDGNLEGEQFCFAVADGASEGLLSGRWASVLVKTFCRAKQEQKVPTQLLDKAHRSWEPWKKNYLLERKRNHKPIQWFEEPGLENGAFSTLLGLTIYSSDERLSGDWRAVALGDSCLFQVDNEKVLAKFPLHNSSSFNSRPLLIGSNPSRNKNVLDDFKTVYGQWYIGSSFFMMTDALAYWFLRETEQDNRPWEVLSHFAANPQTEAFDVWIGEMRRNNDIKNDDITLTYIQILG